MAWESTHESLSTYNRFMPVQTMRLVVRGTPAFLFQLAVGSKLNSMPIQVRASCDTVVPSSRTLELSPGLVHTQSFGHFSPTFLSPFHHLSFFASSPSLRRDSGKRPALTLFHPPSFSLPQVPRSTFPLSCPQRNKAVLFADQQKSPL